MLEIQIPNNEISAEEVRAIADSLPNQNEVIEELLSIMENGAYMQSYNALWVLKHWINSCKREIDAKLSSRLIAFWSESKIRLAHLLLLQCSDYITLDHNNFKSWESFIDLCRRSNHKFVKANSYSGFLPLAKYSKDLIPELFQICEIEEMVAPPSGKGRIKKVKKDLQKLSA
ncbi:hypothetical protein [Luteibaculum oceani]|uniref:Uncharacterized protein n=1 Tax=Luteibaculum oceani TaxID=1294296 RepID=A0A5C6VAB1_9FLAO|nr:hypothetical protein [Luteibaculum oceani]TXC81760.1 hypothetical protein FRX97_04385 [Luteibaculum oceani]